MTRVGSILVLAAILVGCESPPMTPALRYQVRCWNRTGVLMFEGVVADYRGPSRGSAWYFELPTGREVRVSGDCVVEPR